MKTISHTLKQATVALNDCSVKKEHSQCPCTDQLCANVIIIESNIKWCVISVDVTELDTYKTMVVRKKVASILNCDYKNVWITFTHTHSSWFGNSSLAFDQFTLSIINAVSEAINSQAQEIDGIAMLSVDTGNKYAVNRRAFVENMGSFSIYQCRNCKNNGTGIDATEAVKEEFKSMVVDEEQLHQISDVYLNGKAEGVLQLLLFGFNNVPVAGIVRFNAHPVIVSSGFYKPHFSRDYCGALVDYLQKMWQCSIFFMQGPAGNQRPAHTENTVEQCHQFASNLAAELNPKRFHVQFKPFTGMFLATEFVKCNLLDYVKWDPQKRDRQIEVLKQQSQAVSVDQNYLKNKKIYNDQIVALQSVSANITELGYVNEHDVSMGYKNVEISVLKMGSIALLAANNELANFFSLRLYEKFGTANCLVAAYTNGCDGYILEADDFARGGYEQSASVLEPQSSELIVKTACDLISRCM
jgi:hypothetical protein